MVARETIFTFAATFEISFLASFNFRTPQQSDERYTIIFK